MTFRGLSRLVSGLKMVGAFSPWNVQFLVDARSDGGARVRVVIWVPNGYRGRRGKTNVATSVLFEDRELQLETPVLPAP